MDALAGVARELTALSGARCAPGPRRRVSGGGGGAQTCYEWPAGSGTLFVKVVPLVAQSTLAAEAAGLAALAAARTLRVPQVRALGVTGEAAFLALEWLTAGPVDSGVERRLGEGLATLHSITTGRFGFERDNTIGRTPQANAWSVDWTEFFSERRIRPQLALAQRNGLAVLAEPGDRLLEVVPALLVGHQPAASLLHGDLWGGNWLACAGEPVVFDPATYYGDRETDVAMTRLFGGFGPAFYRAYEAAAPPASGAALRTELYNLYHVLNHANLFGGGYVRQARALMERLAAPARA